MAYDSSKLVRASSSFDAKTPALFMYGPTADSIATISAADYFVDDPKRLKVGDRIMAACSDGAVNLAVETATVDAVTVASMGAGGSAGVVRLQGSLADVSAASSAYVVSPVAGFISKLYTILQGAITVADANVKLSIGGVDVTNGALVVATAGSAAGVVDSATPTAARTVTAGGAVKIETDGGSTTTAALAFIIEITPS